MWILQYKNIVNIFMTLRIVRLGNLVRQTTDAKCLLWQKWKKGFN